MRIGVVGYGDIGRAVVAHARRAENTALAFVWVRPPDAVDLPGARVVARLDDEVLEGPTWWWRPPIRTS